METNRGKNKFVLSAQQKQMHDFLRLSVKNAIKSERINITQLSIISNICFASLHAFVEKGRPITSYSLIRLSEVMGYEVALVKRYDGVAMRDNEISQARMEAHKQKQSEFRQKRTGKPKMEKKVKVVKIRNTEHYLTHQSMKSQIAKKEIDDNDFLND